MLTNATIRTKIAILFLLTISSHSFAQISAENQRADLKQLYEALVKTHPGFDRYVTADELLSEYKKLDKSISAPASNWEFYRLAAKMAAAVKCGHTRLRPSSNMSEQVQQGRTFFPLPVAFVDSRMYARMQDQSVKEIIAIDMLSTSEVVGKISQCFPVDGNADLGRYDFIAPAFAVLYARYVGQHPDDFKLTLKSERGFQEVTVKPITFKEAGNLSMTRRSDGPIDYQVRAGAGYLTVMTFGSEEYRNVGASYNDFLAETFRKIKESGIKKLVVDIRDNGGGDDQYGAKLCSYLLNKPFSYFKTVKERGEDGLFHSVQHPCLATQQISLNAFTGEVVLLINGRTFSTAADVAAIFKNSKRGTVMGSETSGGYEGNTSGRSTSIALKNSGMTITIPLWYYENEVEPQKFAHRGVLPDVTITPTVETLNSGKDAALNAAIALLQGKN